MYGTVPGNSSDRQFYFFPDFAGVYLMWATYRWPRGASHSMPGLLLINQFGKDICVTLRVT